MRAANQTGCFLYHLLFRIINVTQDHRQMASSDALPCCSFSSCLLTWPDVTVKQRVLIKYGGIWSMEFNWGKEGQITKTEQVWTPGFVGSSSLVWTKPVEENVKLVCSLHLAHCLSFCHLKPSYFPNSTLHITGIVLLEWVSSFFL